MALSCSLFSPLSFPEQTEICFGPGTPNHLDRVIRSLVTSAFCSWEPTCPVVWSDFRFAGFSRGVESFFQSFFGGGQKIFAVEKYAMWKTFYESVTESTCEHSYPQATHRRKKVFWKAKKLTKNFRNQEFFNFLVTNRLEKIRIDSSDSNLVGRSVTWIRGFFSDSLENRLGNHPANLKGESRGVLKSVSSNRKFRHKGSNTMNQLFT